MILWVVIGVALAIFYHLAIKTIIIGGKSGPTLLRWFLQVGVGRLRSAASVIPGREIVRRFFGVYGDTYGFDFFGRQLIFTRDPKVAHSVLNSADFSKVFDESGVVRALVPQSLLLADGNVWQAHRPIVTGMLSNAVVSELLPIVERVVDEFSDKLCATRDPIKVNGRVDIMKLAFEAISVSILGYRSDSFDAFGAVVQSMTNPWRTYVPFYRFLRTKDNLKLEKSISSLKQMPSDFLESQIRTDSQCFNAALSKSVEALGKEATVDNLVSFLFAGHETTSSFLSFALYHIAADETLQNLLLAEAQQSATPLRGGKMFTSFVKEVLRLYPPAPALGRTAVRGTRLPGGEFLFPGDVIIVSIYGGQRDEKSWPDPDVFKYDRHLSATAPKGDAMYCPFSMGSRTCVGASLVSREAQVILLKLVKRFKIELDSNEPLQVEQEATLRPASGPFLRFKPR